MKKSITQNHIILVSSYLLLASTQTLADRPALSEGTEILVPEVEEISISIDDEHQLKTVSETAPAMDEISAVEVDMQREQEATALEPIETEPTIHVYDHRTNTEITGDIIELQAGETLPVNVLDFPRRGMTMDKVKNELGQPIEVSDSIGKPPITTWTYSDRTVYFEYSSVIHVVGTH